MNKIKLPKLMKLNSPTDKEMVYPQRFGIIEKNHITLAGINPNKKPFYSENQINPENYISRMEAQCTDELGNI
ncbi:MAG: hypothetical protein PVG86_10425 [Desulfobacterales bacterium]|jgi:hypothetical protein